jgi:hypothetical protein
MADFDASSYGERIADIYDDLYREIENVDAMPSFLLGWPMGAARLNWVSARAE